jgi:hypothetical protein
MKRAKCAAAYVKASAKNAAEYLRNLMAFVIVFFLVLEALAVVAPEPVGLAGVPRLLAVAADEGRHAPYLVLEPPALAAMLSVKHDVLPGL